MASQAPTDQADLPDNRAGAEVLTDALRINGVDTVFHLPGEGILEVLDALYDYQKEIKLVTCRHEDGMAMMAESYGKLTGKPGICFAARSPGAVNTCLAVHTAYQDSTPMILFIGSVARAQMEREPFMQHDFRAMFSPMAKWVTHIDHPARIPELVSRAFHVATSGRMGPVVVELGEDMLRERCSVENAKPYTPTQAHPAPRDVEQMHTMLAAAQRPLMLVGGSGWNDTACARIQAFAHANLLPVAAAFRRRDVFDNTHRCYVGEIGIGISPELVEKIKAADLVIALGLRLGEINTIGKVFMRGYSLFDIPVAEQRLVHIHAGVDELNNAHQAELAINSGVCEFAEALASLAPIQSTPWQSWTESLRDAYESSVATGASPGPIDLAAIFRWLRTRLPADAILTVGAGSYALWSQRHFQHSQLGTQIGPKTGAMGYGLPAAIAAKLVHPARTVIALAGDGCFLMTSEELATAVKYGLAIITLVINNNMYGAIRKNQERSFPGRAVGTDLTNPDFVALASAYGAHGELVEETAQFEAAFERALDSKRPAIIELRTA